jgi:ketosteroid isomerase-like protein
MAHPHTAQIEKGFEALSNQHLEALQELMADNIVYHAPRYVPPDHHGPTPLSGDFKGREAVMDVIKKSFELSDGGVEQEVIDMCADDHYAFALVHGQASRKGKTIKGQSVWVFRLDSGKIVEAWLYGDAVPYAEFWGK